MRSRFSSTVTSWPAAASRMAAARPPKPLPTTTARMAVTVGAMVGARDRALLARSTRPEADFPVSRQDRGMNPESEDLVVLLDAEGQPCGTADRSTVHSEQTPLHLAFSCYVVDGEGLVLMTRRALTKRTWPGVWTNACCGHPQPGERFEDAIERRLADELGARATAIAPVLPDFRYEAVDASGIRENEVCPVFVATLVGRPGP